MDKIFKKIRIRTNWLFEDIAWIFRKAYFKRLNVTDKNRITIGITTFMDRFETCLKPLLSKMSILFPECQIIVTANGHIKQKEQSYYLSKINTYCKIFNNVKLITFNEPRGLSHLWNTIIKQSNFSNLLILNDDLKVKAALHEFILHSGILENNIATINSSWSHFLISKDLIEQIGYFDESLLEIGGEDDDYAARLALANIKVVNFNTSTIGNKNRRKREKRRLNSFGRYMEQERGGYSTVNAEYLESKWLMSDNYFNGAIFVPDRKPKFWKLRKAEI